MLSDKLEKALNNQLNSELYAAHLYLSMAAYFETETLPGFVHWMKVQYQEEIAHAMRIFDYLNARNSRVVLHSIDQPPTEFESVRDAMEMALEHEKIVTRMIEDLYREARAQEDYATHVLLEWFIEEQVEEEKATLEIVEHLGRIGDDGTGLLIMDARLASRTVDGEDA